MKTLKKLSLLALVAVSTLSCAEKTAQVKRASKNYPTITIAKSDTEVSVRYTSAIRSVEYVDVMPQISGVITCIKVEDGAEVKKGDILFVIDQVPYQAALKVAKANVESAKASVATAKLNAESAEALFKAKVISQNELQTNLNALSVAEAALAQCEASEIIAQNNLSYTEITSPISGMAGIVPYKIGALVSSSISEPLVTITNGKTMQAYFSVSENQMTKLIKQAGSKAALIKNFPPVQLLLNDKSPYCHLGKLDAISGNIDSGTGSVSLRASFKNPEGILLDGASGSIVLTSTYKDVIVVPKVATFQIQNKVLAYKVIDNKAVSVPITVLETDNGTEYIASSGLEVGDVIVANGAGLIREGMQVTGNPTEEK